VQAKEVYLTGQQRRRRCNDTTGRMDFRQRKEYAAKTNYRLPVDAKVPAFVAKAVQDLYTPGQDKFDGYSQFPRPLCKPYDNQMDHERQASCKELRRRQRKSLGMVVKKAVVSRNGETRTATSPGP